MKSFSGKFVVRMEPHLHQEISRFAQRGRLSLNQACLKLLQTGLQTVQVLTPAEKLSKPILAKLKSKFRENLLGVVLFGSRVQGNATEASDLDVLVVLDDTIALRRSLYSWWDTTFESAEGEFEINPHFVHLPSSAETAGGLWLEVALNSEIVFEKEKTVSSTLQNLLDTIRKGDIIRSFSNGHPYWVRKDAQ